MSRLTLAQSAPLAGRTPPVLLAFAGLLALMLAMGIGRFAYTALLPQMREDGLLGLADGSLLAALNYLGYLVGALWTAFSRNADAPRRLLWGLAGSALSTLAMGLDLGLAGWGVLRFVSGVASAAVYVYSTGMVLRALGEAGALGWSALHYMGVGGGIVLSALVAGGMLEGGGTALGRWMALGAGSVLAAGVVAAVLVPRSGAPQPSPRDGSAEQAGAPPLFWLAAAYGLAGFGYIVNATFLPVMLRGQSGTADAALLGWLVVGVAALPATVLWVRIALRWGTYPALIACTVLQALGVALPIAVPGVSAAMAGAVLLGGTFMGIAGLAQWLARVPDPQRTARRIGFITACYGTGQILGPLLVAALGEAAGFAVPVYAATAALVLSALCLEVSRRRERLG